MGILGKFFKSRKQAQVQAVLVHLDGVGLSEGVYEGSGFTTLEDQLIELLARTKCGEFDGNEISETKATLFMYGPDADLLFSTIEGTLRAYPLCKGARVEIRPGGPGIASREVLL